MADNIRLFDGLMDTPQRGSGLPIRMVPIGDEARCISNTRTLLNKGFYTSATFFPTVARGAAAIRICVSAAHSSEEITTLCELIHEVREGGRTAAA